MQDSLWDTTSWPGVRVHRLQPDERLGDSHLTYPCFVERPSNATTGIAAFLFIVIDSPIERKREREGKI